MISLRSVINTASEVTVSAALSGAVGYLGARLFTASNPIHGAVFCAVASLVSRVVSPVFDSIFSGEGANSASKLIGNVIGFATVISISSFTTTALGFTLPYMAAFHLVTVMAASLAAIALADVAVEATMDACLS